MKKLFEASVRLKILSALLGLSVIPMVVALFIVSQVYSRQIETQMKERIGQVAAFVEATLTNSQVERANYLKLFASNADIINSVYYASLTGDAEQLRLPIQKVAEQYEIDVAEILDTSGNILLRISEDSNLPASSTSEHPVIQGSLEGETSYDIALFDGKLAIVAATPVRLQETEVIGHFVVASFLDETLALRIRSLSQSEVAFFDPKGAFAATIPALNAIDPHQVMAGELRTMDLGDVSHALFTNAIKGKDYGILMALDRSAFLESQATMQRMLLIVLVIAAGLSLLCGLAITNGITRPLTAVVASLKDIAEGEGDLTRELPVASKDEVGQLAEAFNRFNGRLRAMVLRTREVTLDLVKANDQIRRASGEVNEGAQQQSSALNESHQALEGINESVGGIAESTSSLVNASEESSSATLELGATIEEIASQMEKLFAVVEEVTSSISEMSVSSQQITDNVETLSSSTEVTASSVTQLDASIKEIEENAEKTDQHAEQAAQDAQRGKEAVDSTIEGVSTLSEMVEQTSTLIQDLGSQSTAIGKILTVIDEVADQTGLLALNAAIIAAQAGDQGKGFAVVADEIGELAERTAASTREIAAIIKNLQSGTQEAVQAMNNGRNRAREEVDRAKLAGDALEKILGSTFKSREQVRSIVRATQEQARGSRQITTSINQVASMLGQIASAIKQQGVGVQQLARASETMKEIASQVRRSTDEQAQGSRSINQNMEKIRSMIERIDEATREQTLRSSQVVEAVASVRKVSENTASRTAELDQVVELLTRQTQTLEEEMDTFKA